MRQAPGRTGSDRSKLFQYRDQRKYHSVPQNVEHDAARELSYRQITVTETRWSWVKGKRAVN